MHTLDTIILDVLAQFWLNLSIFFRNLL